MLLLKVLFLVNSVKFVAYSFTIDMIDCGVDHDPEVTVGDVEISKYPWYGILWYSDETLNDVRAVTPVILIHPEFVIAAAYPLDLLPKAHFRKNSRVLLGEDWSAFGIRVRNYVVHPQFGETYSTLALVHLRDMIRSEVIKPVCPPPEILENPSFYVIRFREDYNKLQKEVIPMFYVPPRLCKDFYVQSNLYESMMRPPFVVCACSIEHEKPCVWDWGFALVTRDVWGRWLFLGWGVQGAGCSAPSRFLDMLSYYPWVHNSLSKFRPITISRINPHKYVLRSGGNNNDAYISTQTVEQVVPGVKKIVARYGDCDEEERSGRMYRDVLILVTRSTRVQVAKFKVGVLCSMQITCLQLELVNATAQTDMFVRHQCSRDTFGPACYTHKGSMFDLHAIILFSEKCMFEVNIYGYPISMTLLHAIPWHWEEGTYYEDFSMQRTEYRGSQDLTGVGFEPVDLDTWLPDFDLFAPKPCKEKAGTTEKIPNPDYSWVQPHHIPQHLHPKLKGPKVPTRRPRTGSTYATKTPRKFIYKP